MTWDVEGRGPRLSREINSFETRTHRVFGEMADMLYFAKRAGCTQEEYDELLEATRKLSSAMTKIRNVLGVTAS